MHRQILPIPYLDMRKKQNPSVLLYSPNWKGQTRRKTGTQSFGSKGVSPTIAEPAGLFSEKPIPICRRLVFLFLFSAEAESVPKAGLASAFLCISRVTGIKRTHQGNIHRSGRGGITDKSKAPAASQRINFWYEATSALTTIFWGMSWRRSPAFLSAHPWLLRPLS